MRTIDDFYGDYSYVCGQLRFAIGLDTPRADELRAADAELGRLVRSVMAEHTPELIAIIKQRTAVILADPDLPPEYRRSVSV